MIDLRSDTVTRPTEAMRKAMAEAEVGDDAYGEDPTVNKLEEKAAALLGKEAALFVPSGTMANQIAIAVHADRGTEVICEPRSHVVEHELASMAVIAGCMPRYAPAADGVMSAEIVERALRPEGAGLARPGASVIENTHNLAGGAVTPVANMQEIASLARRRGVPIHLDGARIFNAATALNVPAAALAAHADTAMFCLSKGLCAPVGSLLTGPRDLIAQARRWRRRLGGGMRQAGVLAAAGLVALDTMRERLAEDHANARSLYDGLRGIDAIEPSLPEPSTNMVYVTVKGSRGRHEKVRAGLKERGILCNAYGENRLRFVTHRDVTRQEIPSAVEAIAQCAASAF